MLVQNTLRSRLPSVFITGESILTSVFITGELFWTPGIHFADFKENTTIFNGSIILKIDCKLLQLPSACDLCLQKLPNLRDSNCLPDVFITRESITNTNKFANI
jgi:hypothetical protein